MPIGRTKNTNAKHAGKCKKADCSVFATYKGKKKFETKKDSSKWFNLFLQRLRRRFKPFFLRHEKQEFLLGKGRKGQKNAKEKCKIQRKKAHSRTKATKCSLPSRNAETKTATIQRKMQKGPKCKHKMRLHSYPLSTPAPCVSYFAREVEKDPC